MTRIKQFLGIFAPGVLSALLFTSCATLEPSGGESGFVSLFDGKSLEGWKLLARSGEGYVVEDGQGASDGATVRLIVGLLEVIGTVENETLTGSDAAELFHGLSGNDYAYGKGGNDRIFGDDGAV